MGVEFRETEALTRLKLIIPTIHAGVQTEFQANHAQVQTDSLAKAVAQVQAEGTTYAQAGVQTQSHDVGHMEIQAERPLKVSADIQAEDQTESVSRIARDIVLEKISKQLPNVEGGVQTDVQINVQTEVQTEAQPKGQSHSQTELTKSDNAATQADLQEQIRKKENLEEGHLASQKLLEAENQKLKDEVQRLSREVDKVPVAKSGCCILQ